MSIFEGTFPRFNDSPTPSDRVLRSIAELWATQASTLRRAGITRMAVATLVQDGHHVDPAYTPHVYLNRVPSPPDDTEARLLAVNGLLLMGCRAQGERIIRFPLRVPVGLYFSPEGESRPPVEDMPFGEGMLSSPRDVSYPFTPANAALVHDLAVGVHTTRMQDSWQAYMQPDLTLPRALMDLIYSPH